MFQKKIGAQAVLCNNSNGLHFKSFKCQVNLYDLLSRTCFLLFTNQSSVLYSNHSNAYHSSCVVMFFWFITTLRHYKFIQEFLQVVEILSNYSIQSSNYENNFINTSNDIQTNFKGLLCYYKHGRIVTSNGRIIQHLFKL